MMIDGKEYREVADGWAVFWAMVGTGVFILAAVGMGVVVKMYGG